MIKNKWFELIAWIAGIELIGMIIGYATSPIPGTATGDWYQALAKAPWNPPNQAFSIVWPSLYLLMALAIWLVRQKTQNGTRQKITWFFLVHLIVNFAWSFTFFAGQQITLGFYHVILVFGLAAALAVWFYRYSRMAFFLMAPYVLWTCYAISLSYYIMTHN